MPPKLVASDLGRTLVGFDNTIDERTRRAIAAADEVTASNDESGVALVLERPFGLS